MHYPGCRLTLRAAFCWACDRCIGNTRAALVRAAAQLASVKGAPALRPHQQQALALRSTSTERFFIDIMGWTQDMKQATDLSYEVGGTGRQRAEVGGWDRETEGRGGCCSRTDLSYEVGRGGPGEVGGTERQRAEVRGGGGTGRQRAEAAAAAGH